MGQANDSVAEETQGSEQANSAGVDNSSSDSLVSVIAVEPVQSSPSKAEHPFPEEISINSLQEMSPAALQALADTIGWRTNASRNKHQLIYDLLSWMGAHRTRLKVEGVVEIGPEGFGVIRYPKYSFAPLPEDIFVPSFVIRKLGLRPGQRIAGYARASREKEHKDREKYAAIDRVTEIEGVPVENWTQPTPFDKLTPLFPSERIILETPKEPSISSRVVDLVAPLGKGQRALIMASPRSGKTILLKDMAKSIKVNHPEIALIVLLLDERPEEVTDFEESVPNCDIYSSTFDESPKRHTQVAELVSERARRLVEMGNDVVILLDSITRLARGYNALQGGKGRTMSGGMDAKALMKPKKFFGAARNVEEGGSLTIIATALVETESKMDDLIFEEFKGTGNMEISLDREMAERRIYPAIHVTRSGTRKDDLLYHPDEFKRIGMIRRQLAAVPAIEALETLIKNLHRTKSNAELLLSGLK
ncbi:MAG: transcription termination factor Rho [Verrucomicrobiaceae bacterium]|nr:transcription termination factor Rho [Verrucomicrobiaceae bacterium]